MFTDTHCHLIAPEWQQSLSTILARAKAQKVSKLLVPSADATEWQSVLALKMLPEICAVACGVHPWFITEYWKNNVCLLQQFLQQHSDILVGEIGLDKSKKLPENVWQTQITCFETQLDLAKTYTRPIVLHNVHATTAILNSIKRTQFQHGGIAHGFSGSPEEAELLIKKGFLIGLGALLLNPNAKKVRHLAQKLPENSFVLETDSPYMLPNGCNEPAKIVQIAEEISRLRNVSIIQLADICEKNLAKLLVKILPH